MGLPYNKVNCFAANNAKQRYRCLSLEYRDRTFSFNLAHPGRNREMKQQIIEMTLNRGGVRDIALALPSGTAPC